MSGMSSTNSELHKYVIGETRVDGWKSPWRIKLEEDRAADKLKPKPIVSAQVLQERAKPKPREPWIKHPRRYCEVCSKAIKPHNVSGRCKEHVERKDKPTTLNCALCPSKINRNNKHNLCKKCFTSHRRSIQQRPIQICAETGCGSRLRPQCQLSKCRKHSRKERTTREIIQARERRGAA